MAKYLIEIPEGREYFPEFVPMDNFYSGIYMNPEHINAWRSEFYTDTLVGTSLIEEMSELTKAICKERRAKSYDPEIKASIREEIAHVLISLKGYCLAHGITSESIEEEIQKKWPAAYEPKRGECKDCYWSIKTQHNNDMPVLRCLARCNLDCSAIGSCGGFVKKEEK